MHRFLCFLLALPLVIAGAALTYVDRVAAFLSEPFASDAKRRLSMPGHDGGTSFWSATAIDSSLDASNRHEAGVSRRSAARNT